ncbi:MAG: DUF4382 domain-containing protein [Burkholderiaceae bacterium]
MTRHSLRLPSLAAASSALLLAACGGGGGSTGTGTLGVSMTDAPACGYQAVYVTVAKVRVHQSENAGENDAGWSEIALNPARRVNLLDLTNGALEDLGQTALPAGHYTQLRLVLDPNDGTGLANAVVLDDGSATVEPLVTPSAVQSGIKLVNAFDVAAGQRADVVLDFDACKSVVATGGGKYLLKPVVKVIPTVVNGVDGFVSTALLADHVTVSAQQNGKVVRATTPNDKGEFFISHLAPGSYDVVVTADGHAAAVLASVPVADASTTVTLNTAAQPIALPVSEDRAVTGAVAMTPASDTPAYVTAGQTFAGGPTVTLKYRGVDVSSGSAAYRLSNLPAAAPQLWRYAAGATITLTTPAGTTPGAGMYKVEASADGYAAPAARTADVHAADATGVDFTLAAP